jgi:germination protein M
LHWGDSSLRRATILAMLGVFIVSGGIGYYLGRTATIPLLRENRRLMAENRELATETAAVFFMRMDGNNFSLQPVLVRIPRDGDRHRRALAALFAGPPAGSGLERLFPRDTGVLDLKVANGLATVDLNQAATRLNVGAEGEALAVASLVNTLTKFPDIHRVKILVEGSEVESLAGHVDLTQTFGFNDRVLAPE